MKAGAKSFTTSACRQTGGIRTMSSSLGQLINHSVQDGWRSLSMACLTNPYWWPPLCPGSGCRHEERRGTWLRYDACTPDTYNLVMARADGSLASGAWSTLWSNGWQEGEGTFGISWKGVQPCTRSCNHRLLLWEETSSFPPPSPFPPTPSSGLEMSGRECLLRPLIRRMSHCRLSPHSTHSTLWEEHEASVQVGAVVFTCLKRG